MKLSFSGLITKELLLSKYSEETYMEYYLGFPVDKKLHVNPLRQDKHPTAAFYRSQGGELLFHDFGDGSKRNFVSVVMAKFSVGFYEALRIIANDFNIDSDPTLTYNAGHINTSPVSLTNNPPSKIQVEIKPFTKQDLAWWKQFGISELTLNRYHVYSCKTVFLNETPHTIVGDQLVYGYYGGKVGDLELWRIYYPERREFRFLTNWKGTKIQGWDQLPKKGDTVVITKSMKDVMVLHEFGIPACAPNSEMIFLSNAQLDSLRKRFNTIVVLFDNDLPGISSMNRLKKKYPELIYTWIPRSSGSKDLSDYYRDHGQQITYNLIVEAMLWLKTK